MHIENYAQMVKFSLSEDERALISAKADNLNKSFAALKSINTENVDVLYTVLDIKNVLREDVAAKFVSRDTLLSSAPEQYDGYFQVPKTLD